MKAANDLFVEIYTLRPKKVKDDMGFTHEIGCPACVEGRAILRLMRIPHQVFYVEERLLDSYPGWRNGGVERAAWWTMIDRPVPYFFIDGKGYDSKGALAVIAGKLRAAGKFPEGIDLNIDGECHGACSIGGARPTRAPQPAPVPETVAAKREEVA